MPIVITGTKELVAKLGNLKKNVAKNAIRKGSRAGCKILAAAIKDSAPALTGALKRSVKVRSTPRSRVTVGTQVIEKADFAGFLEFGSKHQKAEHKFRDAEKPLESTAVNIMTDTIISEIDKAMKA